MMKAEIREGDVLDRLREMPDESVHCVVTSPPYFGLRDYGTASWEGGDPGCDHSTPRSRGDDIQDGDKQGTSAGSRPNTARICKCGAKRIDRQIGLEESPAAFVAKMVEVFGEVRRVLRSDGVCFMNLGDSYNPDKQLAGMPWRTALALQDAGWWLRQDLIWSKLNPMPESVTDRCTKAHEYIFLLTKSARYFWDAEGIREAAEYGRRDQGAFRSGTENGDGHRSVEGSVTGGDPSTGRNARSVWTIATQPFTDWGETYRLAHVALGDASGDTLRITSSDCPEHAGLPDRVPTRFRGGHVDGELIRTLRKHGRHVPEQANGSALSDWLRTHCCDSDSSDCSGQPRSEIATPHSNRTHRTDPVPSTSPACTASAQTCNRTDGTSATPGPSGSAGRTPASNNGADSASRGTVTTSDQTRSRNVGKCTCTHYRLVSEKMSHFATFPEALPERCVKAGTSDRGCCSKCGAAWVRETERRTENMSNAAMAGTKIVGKGTCNGQDRPDHDIRNGPCSVVTTLGWSPSCTCNADVAPCVVLDPFSGSGTTGAVALKLGRRYIGIELNPEYAALSRKRIDKATKPNTARTDEVIDSPLFEHAR